MHVEGKEPVIPMLSMGEDKNMVTKLLMINLTVFVFLFFTQIIYNIEGNPTARFNEEVLNKVILPANLDRLLHAPWTLITAMFVHNSFWQIFSNMIWLWCFGSLLQYKAGYQRILPLYLFSGLCGTIFYLLGMQFIPSFHSWQPFTSMSGASACVMAFATGSTVVAHNYRIFPSLGGGIPLWIVTVVFIVVNISSHIYGSHDMTYLPALLGGGLAGIFYMQQWKKGNDLGDGFNRMTYKISHIFHPKTQSHLRIIK